MAIKFLDTFTGTDGTTIQSHVTDTPGLGWTKSTADNDCTISSNKMHGVVGATSARYTSVDLCSPAVGDMLFADVVVPTTSTFPDSPGLSLDIGRSAFTLNGYALFLNRTGANTVEVVINDYDSGTTILDVPGVAWTDGQEYRIVMEFTSATTLTVWREPAGGGAHTAIGVATTATNPATIIPGAIQVRFFGNGDVGSFDNVTLFSPTPLPPLKEASLLYADRRILGASCSPSYSMSTDGTTYTVPFPVATDGSEGILQVMRSDGSVLSSTRPTPTTVFVTGYDTTADAGVMLGLQYTFTVTLSPIIYRPALRFGDPTATLSGRLQLRWMDFWYGASRYAKVTVTPQGRTAYEYVLSKDTAESDKFHVPLLTKNDVTITITNDKPLPFFLTGGTWEGFFHDRSQRG